MDTLLPDDEKELLHQLRAGDEAAFEQLYNQYKGRMAANLFNLLKSWDEAEEHLQELFFRIWKSRQKIDPDKSFQAYIYRIATNLVYDHFRKIAKDQSLTEQLWYRISALHDPQALASQIKADGELMRIIEMLPPKRRMVFKLCKLEGKSYAEVAEKLAISTAAVNDHITKANKFLLDNFDKSVLLALFCERLVNGF